MTNGTAANIRLSGALTEVLKRNPKRMPAKVVSTALSRKTVPVLN